MALSKLVVFAKLALAASAILISLGDDHALATLAIDPSQRTALLECPGCAFATAEGGSQSLKWKAGAGNAFLLDFNTGPQENTLNLDNYQLYPPSFSVSDQPFYVTQVDPASEERLRLRVTGYEFRYNGAETISEAGTELLPMTLELTSVEGTAVNPPALNINVLKTAQGGLMIASFNEAQPTEATPTDQEKECNEWPLLCKWKSIMADRIEKMKKMGRPSCHKPRPGNPMEHEGIVGKPPHRFRPGMKPHHPHHRPHHMAHHDHRHHRFSMFVRRAFFTIFVPILIGIFAGTLTYLVGMFVGCLIAITIAKVRGQHYQPIALDEEDVEEAEERGEKEEYAELPAYDAPPVYVEAAEKEVAEAK